MENRKWRKKNPQSLPDIGEQKREPENQKSETRNQKSENGKGRRKIPTLRIEGGVVGDCGEAPAHGDVLGGCRRGAIAGLFPTFHFGDRGYDTEEHRVCSKLNRG
jgi:hypothetical protein